MVHRLKAMKLKCLRPEEPFFALESGKGLESDTYQVPSDAYEDIVSTDQPA